MQINITFKNFEPSEHLRKYAERRFAKLERLTKRIQDVELTVILSIDKKRHNLDVNLFSDKLSLSAVESGDDMYACIDLAVDKLQTQIKKFNEKRVSKAHVSIKDLSENVNREQYTIQYKGKEKSVHKADTSLSPLHPEEAFALMKEKNLKHLVFIDEDTDALCVLYRQEDNSYCLIETVE